jgi:hypothetical protein
MQLMWIVISPFSMLLIDGYRRRSTSRGNITRPRKPSSNVLFFISTSFKSWCLFNSIFCIILTFLPNKKLDFFHVFFLIFNYLTFNRLKHCAWNIAFIKCKHRCHAIFLILKKLFYLLNSSLLLCIKILL